MVYKNQKPKIEEKLNDSCLTYLDKEPREL